MEKGQYLYVIGLHAVQFGINEGKKVRGQGKLGEAVKESPISENFNSINSKLDNHVVLLLISYIAG